MPRSNIPTSPEMAKILKKQLKAFRKKFHRDPGPEDPVFFDPEADTPRASPETSMDSMWESMLEAARAANIRPEILYAMRKTGLIVTEQNMRHLTPEEMAEWNSAIEEFNAVI